MKESGEVILPKYPFIYCTFLQINFSLLKNLYSCCDARGGGKDIVHEYFLISRCSCPNPTCAPPRFTSSCANVGNAIKTQGPRSNSCIIFWNATTPRTHARLTSSCTPSRQCDRPPNQSCYKFVKFFFFSFFFFCTYCLCMCT